VRINFRKSWKILRRIWSTAQCILKAFCTHEHRDAPASMQDTHNHLFNSENQTKAFSYTLFVVKKINVGKKLKL
jgi:hypothetical protein